MVERVHRQLDQTIRQAARTGSCIAGARGATQWGQCDSKGGSTNWIEDRADREPSVLTPGHVEAPALDRVDVFAEHRRGIADMARVGAVETEAAHSVLKSQREQRPLVEADPTGPTRECSSGTGEESEMAVTDLTRVKGGGAAGQLLGHLAGCDCAPCRTGGHAALMANPIDR
jgi:hypothetical protein